MTLRYESKAIVNDSNTMTNSHIPDKITPSKYLNIPFLTIYKLKQQYPLPWRLWRYLLTGEAIKNFAGHDFYKVKEHSNIIQMVNTKYLYPSGELDQQLQRLIA